MAAKKGGLGRGLDALFADVPVTAPETNKKAEEAKKRRRRTFRQKIV